MHPSTNISQADERLLLLRVSEGDRDAFSTLYSHYTPLLSRFLFPLTGGSTPDAEEVIQEIFLNIWEKKEVLLAIQSFEAYVFRMARNKMVSRFRKKTLARRAARDLSQSGEILSNQTADDLLLVEYHAIARKALAELSPRQRQIFELRTQESLRLDEIALRLGIGLPAVKKQLYAAIGQVRAYLRQHAGLVLTLVLILYKPA